MEALAEMSARFGTELRWRARLAGGEQNGAHLVEGPTGRLFVVKHQSDLAKARRLLQAAPAVQFATDHGWPAARWLWAGPLGDGTAVVVQEHLAARSLPDLDVPTIEAVVTANARQADLAHPDAFNDSAQLTAVLHGRHPWKAAVADHTAAGAALVRHGDAALARAGVPELPVDDVVHGDYSSTNMLLTAAGTVVFIDCETAGRGSRVRDLADLYRQCFIYPGAPAPAMELLRAHAAAIAGPETFVACVVGVTYNNLSWWVEHKTEAEFDLACARAHDLFTTCQELL